MSKEHLKNIRIGYQCEATVNTGDFNNVKPGFTVSADVADGASPTEAKNFLVKIVDAWLEEEIGRIKDGLK